ncbi:hypothetical protein BC829DRAFT_373460 [Chytridium lagenaria]|nr:hypothetical protein BC829DRAFT_373460 [Chytridium lagenaria]
MEKYSRWRDAGTGIAPFIPPKKLRSDESFIYKGVVGIQTYLFGPIVGLVRFLLLGITSILFTLLDFLGLILIVPFVRRGWSRLLSSIFGRLSLWLLGFWWIKYTNVSLKKGVRAKQEKQRSGKGKIEGGDVIISNYSSYIDVIVLEMLFSPNFLYVHPTGKVQIISFTQALIQASSYPPHDKSPPPSPTPLITLKEAILLSKQQNKPLSLFPEGTTSNNRGLLNSPQY